MHVLCPCQSNRKALELCAEATKEHDFKDWWWKARLGKCYYKLGLYRDAEKQLRSSIKVQPVIQTYLELVNVYVRLDLPNTALDVLQEAWYVILVTLRTLLFIESSVCLVLSAKSSQLSRALCWVLRVSTTC